MSRRNGGRLRLTPKIGHSLEFLKLSEAIKQLYLNQFIFFPICKNKDMFNVDYLHVSAAK